MSKRFAFVIVALFAVCVLSPLSASAARRRASVSVNTEEAQKKAEERLRRAAAKADRAARKAGVRVKVRRARNQSANSSLAAARRDSIKRAIKKRITSVGTDIAGEKQR